MIPEYYLAYVKYFSADFDSVGAYLVIMWFSSPVIFWSCFRWNFIFEYVPTFSSENQQRIKINFSSRILTFWITEDLVVQWLLSWLDADSELTCFNPLKQVVWIEFYDTLSTVQPVKNRSSSTRTSIIWMKSANAVLSFYLGFYFSVSALHHIFA